MISSLGKALGLSGGIIAADKEFIDRLRVEPIFTSSSGANPIYLEAFITGFHLYEKQRKKLMNNLKYLHKKLAPSNNFLFNKIYPVIYSTTDTVYKSLWKEKIIIARFKYPTYENYMNRIVITANHTKKDLDKLVGILNSIHLN